MDVDEDLLYSSIGKQLLERRLQMSITQAQLAEKAGILRTSVANFETARQRVPLHVLYKLCAVLGLEASAVLPATSSVVTTPVETVDVQGNSVSVPPMAAETLRQMQRRLMAADRGDSSERS